MERSSEDSYMECHISEALVFFCVRENSGIHQEILLAPLTTSAQRSWWYYWLSVVRRPSSSVVRRPSVNFCFKSLLLLQFLFDNSEFFTGETRHIVPPCNKAGISKFLLRIPEIAEIPDFLKTLLLLQFLFENSEFFTGETRHIVPPCNKAGISNFCLEFQKLQKFQIAEIPVKTALLISSYSIILKFYWKNLVYSVTL